MFTIRIGEALAQYYDDLAKETNRSRNEVIALALRYAKERIKIGDQWSIKKNEEKAKIIEVGLCKLNINK